MRPQSRVNKRYIERNKEKVKEQRKRYYQLKKEYFAEKQRIRNIQKREGAYRWFNKIVTGYLPYDQGNKK